MKIAAVLNAHGDADVLLDTIDSIRTYLTSDILVVIDGAKEQLFKDVTFPAYRTVGLRHGKPSSPYRNVALGLMNTYLTWPHADWYLYTEYDCLVGSDRVLEDLKSLPDHVWCVGNDYRLSQDAGMGLVGTILKSKIEQPRYLLGCCMFMRQAFLTELTKADFFQKFLWYTNSFTGGYFPGFNGYDISEYLYPTLACHFGGTIKQLARFRNGSIRHDGLGTWEGDAEGYPLRWKPDLIDGIDPYKNASVMHPLKTVDHPIRQYHRKKREIHVGRAIAAK